MAGLSLCLLVAVGLVAWSLTDVDEPYVAPVPPEARVSFQPDLASETLETFEQAVRDGDVAAARSLAPDEDPAAAGLLAAVVRNARALGVTDFTLRYVDDDGGPDQDGARTASVDATWRFRGFDATESRAEIRVHLMDQDGTVAVTGFGGGDRVSPLWLSGPLQVRRGPDTLVMVDGSAADADRYAARAAAAVPQVREVIPSWQRGLVVEVPASVDELDRTLDADPGSYDQIAAVTTSADGSQAPGAPVHVFANPDIYDDLRSTGAQVVMTHEATHVATGAWSSQMPLWLLEGFADYVALRDVDLPLSSAAAQIIADVRRDGTPRKLPGPGDFGTRTPDLGATYESAWLATRLLGQRGGEQALLDFYGAVDDGETVDEALRASFGISEADLTAQWRTLLSDLAE